MDAKPRKATAITATSTPVISYSNLNLLCSDGGIEFMPEICLRVVELLIESDPKEIGRMLLVSKSLTTLLRTCEKSITKSLSRHDPYLRHLNGLEQKIFSSQCKVGNIVLSKYTYPWLSEMKFRKEMVQFLITHEITKMEDTIDGWPSLNVSKDDLHLKLDLFKIQALFLLFRLSDCATGLYTKKDVREQQSRFLYSLSAKELACLGVMVEVIGHNFFIITKRSILELGFIQNDVVEYSNSSHFMSYNPHPNREPPAVDLLDDNLIRETMCVFEDLVQRYGPKFAWAYFEGRSKEKKARYHQGQSDNDKWAHDRIEEGLDNMNAFELGYTMSYASLQSVVWRTFRLKQGCRDINSWNVAKGLVETEMINYGK